MLGSDMRTLWATCLASTLFAATAAASTVTVEFASIPHGKLSMDIVRPEGAGPHPAVMLIHGGGFNAGSRESMLPMARQLAANGFVAAAISYRLAPTYQFPVPLYDVKAAVRYLRANAAKHGIDARYIGALGVSAGATWAQFLGVTGGVAQFEGAGPHRDQSSAVTCVVSYYGRSDMRRAYEGSRNAPTVLPLLLGGDRSVALGQHLLASPLNWITPSAAPLLAVHGTRDQNVPFEQSVWLVERLRSVGVEAELETLAEAGHGFKGADGERAFTRTIDFLNRQLKPKKLETRRIVVNDHGAGKELLALAWPSGRVLWRRPNGGATDFVVLPNGHVLYIADPKGLVLQIDATQNEVWRHQAQGVNLVSVSRLENGHTLLVDDGQARVFEVDAKGETVWSVEKPEYAGQAMRRARRAPNGHTLVTVQKLGLLLELDAKGAVVSKQEFAKRLPAYALPLPDGGMYLGLAGPGEVRRVDAQGAVRQVFAGDGVTRLAWSSGFVPTPEGGLIVSDYQGARIVEFDAQGKLLHELRNIPWAVTAVGLLP